MKEVCRETLEKAYLFLDGEMLSDDERAEIERHLHACAPCYERYGLEKEITLVLARLEGATQCPEKLRAKISGLIQEA